MAQATSIEWATDVWNPVAGCDLVSPGCTNCYAMRMAARLEAMGQAKYAGLTEKVNGNAVWTGRINLDHASLAAPLSWKKPRRVFVNSMSDLFHEGVPFDYVDQVFAVMSLCPQHTFQVLTKRPGRMEEYFSGRTWGDVIAAVRDPDAREPWVRQFTAHYALDDVFAGTREGATGYFDPPLAGPRMPQQWPLPNVWLGVSVEDQKRADERIPVLLDCPAIVRFLSVEPLLGPVDLKLNAYWNPLGRNSSLHLNSVTHRRDGIGWVIVGGESGPGARPFHPEWALSLVDQCHTFGPRRQVACFVKQLGSNVVIAKGETPWGPPHNQTVAGRVFLKDKKGGDMAEWPENLRVREFPQTNHEPAEPAKARSL